MTQIKLINPTPEHRITASDFYQFTFNEVDTGNVENRRINVNYLKMADVGKRNAYVNGRYWLTLTPRFRDANDNWHNVLGLTQIDQIINKFDYYQQDAGHGNKQQVYGGHMVTGKIGKTDRINEAAAVYNAHSGYLYFIWQDFECEIKMESVDIVSKATKKVYVWRKGYWTNSEYQKTSRVINITPGDL